MKNDKLSNYIHNAEETLLLKGNDGGGAGRDGRESEQDDGVAGAGLDSVRADAMKIMEPSTKKVLNAFQQFSRIGRVR